MSRLKSLRAREVLDSRGRPTVEVEAETTDGAHGRAIAPAGASTGAAEAVDLRDGGTRYGGFGVRRAVSHVLDRIAPSVIGHSVTAQAELDGLLRDLDGTAQLECLGANAILAVSLAVAHAAADSEKIPLYVHLNRLANEASDRQAASDHAPSPTFTPAMPTPMTNMISGGLHAGGNLDFQDYLVMPRATADTAEAIEQIAAVYRCLGQRLHDAGYGARLVGDEGGYGPELNDNREALSFIVAAIEDCGLQPGAEMGLAVDVAATHFYSAPSRPSETAYHLRTESRALTRGEMIDRYVTWSDEFPLVSIEDGLAEEDWDGWSEMTRRLGGRVWIVGDDLLVTNPKRVQRAIDQQAATAVLLKVNQIGTLTSALETAVLARRAGMTIVVSARSGETEDTTIADLAVALGAESIKIGSIVRGERTVKYNRLLRIAEDVKRIAGGAKDL